jgi:predicted alpha-1,2-mannosidase
VIAGFSHTHLSGTGVADLFDFLFMPFRGEVKWEANIPEHGVAGYSSAFSHDNEVASPGYYRVILDDAKIKAELSATAHCGIHRYQNLEKGPFHLMIDLNHSLDKKRPYWSCKVLDAQIRIVDNKTIEGYRAITGWANERRVYFRAEFSKPFSSHQIKAGTRVYNNANHGNHQNLKLVATFSDSDNEPLEIKVGLSAVSYQGARENLHAEMSGFDFDQVSALAREKWNNELSVIEMEGTERQKTIFYTSLYHLFIHPSNIADVNGDYINSNGEVKNAPDNVHYSTFSLWDTYRAAHPLYTLVQPARTAGFINSMLRQYTDYGYLPIWQLWGKETYCMIGNHAIPVIVDAYEKRIPGVNYALAWEAIKASSLTPHRNSSVHLLDKYGYFPENLESQSVSITLETAFNDWCVAHMAGKLKKQDEVDYFTKRSQSYKNLFDSNIGFFRAKDDKGNWIEPFSPLKYGGNGGYPFTEGNGWQYLWYVPHNVYQFMNLLGGEKKFTQKLDEFFTLDAKPDDVNGNASGFIGQYAHGNEPSHHIVYLYNYTSEPWKAQYYSAKIVREQYTTDPSGYTGNEDCGQMSAWYIFSSLGFYPVNPANSIYSFGSPYLAQATIRLPEGKAFKVMTHKPSEENIYIQKILLNGKPYLKNFITHKDIVAGGTLEFFMGKKPNRKMATYEKPPLSL